MKSCLFSALALLATVTCASLAQAGPAPGPKRPGPSAVEAARLKKSPPPNYLAHYLPDDRYKIAGGVWKYVSTDLDTYYHVPSSPNMLRQPANRVIGFANARDAEEAGYIADPTDGTAQRAAPVTVPSANIQGTGNSYVDRISQIIRAGKQEEIKWLASLKQTGDQGRGPTPAVKAAFAQLVPLIKRSYNQMRAVKPPQKYARFHSLLLLANRQSLQAAANFSRSLNQGQLDLGSLNFMDQMESQQALVQEARRVGINLQTLGQ